MSAKESTKKKINLDGVDGFQKKWHAQILLKRITQQRRRFSYDMGWDFSSSRKHKQQCVSGRQKAENYVKMLNSLSLAQEKRRLCGEERIFQ